MVLVLYFVEFDSLGDTVYLVKNGNVLEQRSVTNKKKVVSLELEEKIKPAPTKQVALSDDGFWIAIAGGVGKSHFYLIETQNSIQTKMTSDSLKNALAPCFVNVESTHFVIGGVSKYELWDVDNKTSLRMIQIPQRGLVLCSYSVNGVLAIAGTDGIGFKLYDTKTFTLQKEEEYSGMPFSLHLTNNIEYVTLCGVGGEICVVLKITGI